MPLQRDVVRAWLELYGREETKRLLRDYFEASSVGKDEKCRSQHKDKDIDSLIDDIVCDALS